MVKQISGSKIVSMSELSVEFDSSAFVRDASSSSVIRSLATNTLPVGTVLRRPFLVDKKHQIEKKLFATLFNRLPSGLIY